MEMIYCPHNCMKLPTCEAITPLALIQGLTVVGYHSILTVLYLGQHSCDPDVTRVCSSDEPLLAAGKHE
jgi:hypothetical protein